MLSSVSASAVLSINAGVSDEVIYFREFTFLDQNDIFLAFSRDVIGEICATLLEIEEERRKKVETEERITSSKNNFLAHRDFIFILGVR